MLQRTLANHKLECLDVHEELALVIVCTTRIDCSVTDLWLERIRMPEFDRVNRLNVVVAVNEDSWK